MDSERIDGLLAKYFEAETTLPEEEELKTYFAGAQVAGHLQKYIPLFNFLSESKGKQPVIAGIQKPYRGITYKIFSVAAVGLLFLGIFQYRQYQQHKEAQFAYEQTREAFRLIAKNLSLGTEKVSHLKTFSTTTQKIYRYN